MLALIPLFPLIGFLINGLWYAFGQAPVGRKKAGVVPTGTIASAAIFASFIVSLISFIQLTGMPEDVRVLEQMLFSWMSVGDLDIEAGFRLDVLSGLYALFITGIGTLIHVYSVGYMHDDETPGKYFSYLNLFCFAMLVLVLGSNIPMTFFGWEGVGLCSYLLIGYWYQDTDKASAGKKAFIANRVGDLGVLLGMFLIYTTFGTLDYAALAAAVGEMGAMVAPAVITAICLFLFLGCTGKSAQIPLFVWLPDAMAGPTPVSALIHAATMVTSGIYLVTRLNFLYDLSPVALSVVAWIGAATAFLAATIAIAQNDIKKVLAYSTVSQLGYMFLACGVGAYGAGVFHVVTHAFFKALLFLGAGSVIYGMHHEQDIMKMGGLRAKMPKTFWVFAIAWLAICGIFPFAGFWSKDEILWMSLSSPYGSPALWAVGTVTAVMTAFYMTRLFSLTFLGKPRTEHAEHAHETPAVMSYPLMVLAVLSAVGGFMGIPHASWLAHWLEPVVPHPAPNPDFSFGLEIGLMVLSVALAAGGILAALKLYSNLERAGKLRERFSGAYALLANKWYVDEFYELTLIRPLVSFSRQLWKRFDEAVIDRLVVGFGRASYWAGSTARVVQTGSMQLYGLMLLVGVVVILGYLVYGLA